jgi:hypothetical protein
MTDPGTPSEASRRARAQSAIALICAGLLILVPSGLCTAYFGIAMIGDSKYFLAVPMVGGPPIVLGAVLFLIGLRLRRR